MVIGVFIYVCCETALPHGLWPPAAAAPIEIPAYLTASDIALAYRPKPGTVREIPFADSFETMKHNLRWREADAGISRAGTQLRVRLEPNELVVIE